MSFLSPARVLAAFLCTFALAEFAAAQTAPPAPASATPPGVPAVPLGAAMVANSPHSITLSWYRPAKDDATSYVVLGGAAKTGPFSPVATVKERTATESNLAPGATRFYQVKAVNAQGESAPSAAVSGFTFEPTPGAPFPVKLAKNMCLTEDTTILSTPAPAEGKLAALVDGSDGTSCTINGACEVKMKLNPALPIKDAAYLILNFRSDNTGKDYAYNINWRALKDYVVTESLDSTNGTDGTWTEVASGSNQFLDGVVVFPNHQPKWIGVKNSGTMQLCRLQLFRAAPKGFRNDYWIFTGDSLVVQDLAGGSAERHTVWFADLVRKSHPDRYPIVVQSALGGEMMGNTLGRLRNSLPILSAANGSDTPTGTIVCWEPGFNDIGVGGGLWMGPKIVQNMTDAQEVCTKHGLIIVPVRIEFSTGYLDLTTLEPTKYNVFYNTLPVNLAGVDVFCRTKAPYACDPQTQLPFADYWNYTRRNYATALAKDGVHHTKAGSDGINTLWADVASRMIYAREK